MATTNLQTVIQVKRGTTLEWLANKDFVPASGEPCLDLDFNRVKYGNGIDTYENLEWADESFITIDHVPTASEMQDGIFYLLPSDENETFAVYAKVLNKVLSLSVRDPHPSGSGEINSITINGVELQVTEGVVDLPIATQEKIGLVKGSNEDNKISILEDGTMEVNSLDVTRLTQTNGDSFVLDGGFINQN